MYLDETLLFKEQYMISVNKSEDPLFYCFDYDTRSYRINMAFQHFHHFYEIYIPLDPNASHLIEGDYYALQPYDIVLLRPSLLHKTEYPTGDPCRRLVIAFSFPVADTPMKPLMKDALAPFESECPIYRFQEDVRAQAFSHLNAIFRMGRQPNTPLSQLCIQCELLEFLAVLAQNVKQNTYHAQDLADSITHKVYSVTSYIHRHYTSDLSLESLSKEFFISPYYLSHQFRRVTGFSLINYIQITRVRNAQQLLLYTDMKIADITTQCGFTSFSQFNRVFNKFCHVSPSQFRIDGQVRSIEGIPYEKRPSPGSSDRKRGVNSY